MMQFFVKNVKIVKIQMTLSEYYSVQASPAFHFQNFEKITYGNTNTVVLPANIYIAHEFYKNFESKASNTK